MTMEPGLIHLVRWALYVDIGLIFGLPATAMAVGGRYELARWRGLLIGAGLICVPLSIFGFLLNVADMAGVSLNAVDWNLALTILTSSTLGLAFIARCLAALVYSVLMGKGRPNTAMIAGGMAAITLAWSGHGGSSQGALGVVRLIGDMLHLLAASAWVGALVLFILTLFSVRPSSGYDAQRSGALLSAFALPGTIIVGTLLLTGISNMLFIAPPSAWPQMAKGSYGRAMFIKLVLFFGMLSLATINRFVLTPRLLEGDGNHAVNVRAAKISIAAETVAGIAILALVAWLGMLDPAA